MYVKIHKSNDRSIIAICDEDLIGKKFSQKNLVLDVTERFYKGEIMSDEKVIELMKSGSNLNIVGKKSINLAIKNGIIESNNIIKIDNIPFDTEYIYDKNDLIYQVILDIDNQFHMFKLLISCI
jgi:hypothetical protein